VTKLLSGVLAWPALWVSSARTEDGCLGRLLLAMCAPLAAGTVASPATGGWALPVVLASVSATVIAPLAAAGFRDVFRRLR